MTIFEKIVKHSAENNYVKIKRDVGKKSFELSHGYILAYSFDFVLIIENNDFLLNGYAILPITAIVKIRHNYYDQFFDSIMEAEGQKNLIQIPYQIDLENWETIFNSIESNDLTCSIQNENEQEFFFKIGQIAKIKGKSVQIRNFDPAGYLDDEPTKIMYKSISQASFGDNYITTISKYTRERE